MKILVTGSRGMLGSAIKEVFADQELILTGSIELDVRNIKQVMAYAKKKPELIIHAAAETDHVAAEFDPVACYMLNATGTQNMVELARCLDIPIVYVGTCGIFDGSQPSYSEMDRPTPLNHYGRSKYYGELITETYRRHYIVRCGWGMGGGYGVDKKFINKIFQEIKAGAVNLYSISDVFGSPTYQPDFARTIRSMIFNKVAYGTWNLGADKASRYEVAQHFVACLGLADRVKVEPLTFEQYHERNPYQVIYTKCEVLNCDKLGVHSYINNMRPWRVALAEYAKAWIPYL